MVDICDDMWMGVKGCEYFSRMCRNETIKPVVKQCKTPTLSHVLPKTAETKALVEDICKSMPMDGCEKCKSGDHHCDYLEVYSHLCLQMDDMKQCAKWKSLCEVIPTWPICTNENPHSPPQMRMYFHFGIKDYVLFKNWVPKTSLQYFGTWVAIFAMGIFYDVIKLIRSRLEKRWEVGATYTPLNSSSHEKTDVEIESPYKFRFKVEIVRAILQAIEMTWGYFLMLIAMTFNVGLFGAVIAGAFVGSLLFGRR